MFLRKMKRKMQNYNRKNLPSDAETYIARIDALVATKAESLCNELFVGCCDEENVFGAFVPKMGETSAFAVSVDLKTGEWVDDLNPSLGGSGLSSLVKEYRPVSQVAAAVILSAQFWAQFYRSVP